MVTLPKDKRAPRQTQDIAEPYASPPGRPPKPEDKDAVLAKAKVRIDEQKQSCFVNNAPLLQTQLPDKSGSGKDSTPSAPPQDHEQSITQDATEEVARQTTPVSSPPEAHDYVTRRTAAICDTISWVELTPASTEDEEAHDGQREEEEITEKSVAEEAAGGCAIKRQHVLLASCLVFATIVSIVLAATVTKGGGSQQALQIPPSCAVKATIDCRTLDGRTCEGVGPPITAACNTQGTEGIMSLELSYQGGTCDSSSHQQGSQASCVDTLPPAADEEEVTIECVLYSEALRRYESCRSCCVRASARVVNVVPDRVRKGDTVALTMSDGETLPEFIECVVRANNTNRQSSGSRGIIQSVRMATRGPVPLSLRDRVGSLQVESCGDLTCIHAAQYTVYAQNAGGDAVNLTQADFLLTSLDTVHRDVFGYDALIPGSSSVFETAIEFNTCGETGLSARLTLFASSENGDSCSDEDVFFVDQVHNIGDPRENERAVSGPQLPADDVLPCGLSVSVGCAVVSTDFCLSGFECSAPIPAGDVCVMPPHGMTFLVVGGSCEQSDRDFLIIPTEGFSCEDFNPGPPMDIGTKVHVQVTSEHSGLAGTDSLVYFDGVVAIGDLFSFTHAESQSAPLTSLDSFFDSIHVVSISAADQSTLLQRLTYQSTCISSLSAVRLGSLQFFAITESSGNIGSGFNTVGAVEFPVTVKGESDDVSLTSLTFETNFAGTINLTSQIVGQTAHPDGTLVATLAGELNRFTPIQLTLRYTVEGFRASDDKSCIGIGMETIYVAPILLLQ